MREVMWKYLILLGTPFLLTGVWGETTEVLVEAGTQAVLPCVSLPLSSSAATILWSKTPEGTIWRRQKSGLEYWALRFSQRVGCPHSEAGTGDYSLHIRDVSDADGGEYVCEVVDRGMRDRKTVFLRVIKVSVSPPDQVVGKQVEVTCSVTPWSRWARLSWRLNGESPRTRDLVSEASEASGRVLKTEATQNMKWTCVVRHRGKEGNATQALVWRGITSPSSDSTRVYAAVGSAVTLPCVFSPGLAPSDLQWERLSEGPASALPARPSFNLSSVASRVPWDGSLGVPEVGPGDGGRYRCSGRVEGTRVVRDMQLVTAQVHSSAASAGSAAVTLTCRLSNASEVVDYEWVELTYDLNGTQSASPVQKGKVLQVAAVAGSGEWACRFYGKQGILGNVTYQLHLSSGLTGVSETVAPGDVATVTGLSLLLLVLLLVLVQMCKNYQRRGRILLYPAMETLVHAQSNEREDRERKRVKADEI